MKTKYVVMLVIIFSILSAGVAGSLGWYARDYKFYRDFYMTTRSAALPILGTDD